jgi:putative membrane protein
MTSVQNTSSVPGTGSRGILIALAAAAAAAIGWAAFSTWSDIRNVGEEVFQALWTLPLIILVHGAQLVLSSLAWRNLFRDKQPGIAAFFRLRLIREGIDSLFPVAQVGGEVIASGMLTRRGVPAGQSGASVIVDVTLEVLSQAAFLLAGVATLSLLADGEGFTEWFGVIALAVALAGGAWLAQRLGILRLLEWLVEQIGKQFPALAGMSLAGLNDAAQGFYDQGRTLFGSTVLHFLSWALGTLETWIILRALGSPASLAQAFVIESLGMAARSAGFAIPGALAVQEGGFALAALSVGLPESAGLSLSLVKRAREVSVGAAGVALARWGGEQSMLSRRSTAS